MFLESNLPSDTTGRALQKKIHYKLLEFKCNALKTANDVLILIDYLISGKLVVFQLYLSKYVAFNIIHRWISTLKCVFLTHLKLSLPRFGDFYISLGMHYVSIGNKLLVLHTMVLKKLHSKTVTLNGFAYRCTRENMPSSSKCFLCIVYENV